jgi:hypothetical protein
MFTVTRYDSAGYAIPFVGDDDIEECVAALTDPVEYEDPSDWPAWTDADKWEPGPAIPPDATIVPPELEPDGEWRPEAEPYEPSDEDRADYERWLDRLDALARLHDMDAAYDRLADGWVGADRIDDDDVRVATGSCG